MFFKKNPTATTKAAHCHLPSIEGNALVCWFLIRAKSPPSLSIYRPDFQTVSKAMIASEHIVPVFVHSIVPRCTYQHIQKTNWEDCWSQSKIDELNIKPYMFQASQKFKILYEFREVRSCSLRFEAAPWLSVMAACQYLGQLPLPGVDRIKIRPKRKSVGKSGARFISRKLWL